MLMKPGFTASSRSITVLAGTLSMMFCAVAMRSPVRRMAATFITLLHW